MTSRRWTAITLVLGLALAGLLAIVTLIYLSTGPITKPLQTWVLDKPVTTITFSPDGQSLAVGTTTGDIQLRQVESGTLVHTLSETASEVRVLTFSRDGKFLASGDADGNIRLWDVHSGTRIGGFDGQTRGIAVSSLALNPDETLLASGNSDGNVRIWRVATGELRQELTGLPPSVHFWRPPIIRLAFSSDGHVLTAGDKDDGIQQWQMPDGQLLHTAVGYNRKNTSNSLRSMAFTSNTEIAATSYDGIPEVYVWRLSSGGGLATLAGIHAWSLAFSPDGQVLAGGAGHSGVDPPFISLGPEDMSIRLWNVTNGHEEARLVGHTNNVRDMAWAPNGKILASGSDDGTIRLWQVVK